MRSSIGKVEGSGRPASNAHLISNSGKSTYRLGERAAAAVSNDSIGELMAASTWSLHPIGHDPAVGNPPAAANPDHTVDEPQRAVWPPGEAPVGRGPLRPVHVGLDPRLVPFEVDQLIAGPVARPSRLRSFRQS